MAISMWKPARDGVTWAEFNAAWLILHTLIMHAAKQDREERT